VSGFIVVWKRLCKFRLAALFSCRYVDGVVAASGPWWVPVPDDDDRRERSWCDGSRSRSGLGGRDCARDGARLAPLLADLLGEADSEGFVVVSIGGETCSESERRSSELTYSRSESPWPVGRDTYCASIGVWVPDVTSLCRPSWSVSSCTGLMPCCIHGFATRRTAWSGRYMFAIRSRMCDG
jgi:hypothetical protein